MRTTLNFQFEVLYSCRQIKYGQGDNVKTYNVKTYAFGLPRYSNQPCNLQNEVDVPLHKDDESNSVELVGK